eukprot:g64808.t1
MPSILLASLTWISMISYASTLRPLDIDDSIRSACVVHEKPTLKSDTTSSGTSEPDPIESDCETSVYTLDGNHSGTSSSGSSDDDRIESDSDISVKSTIDVSHHALPAFEASQTLEGDRFPTFDGVTGHFFPLFYFRVIHRGAWEKWSMVDV